MVGRKICGTSVTGMTFAARLLNDYLGSGFSLGLGVSRYDASLNLINVLDQLREAYDLAKEAGHTDLQERLMVARRQLTEAVHQCLELAEAHEHAAQTRGNGSKPSFTRHSRGADELSLHSTALSTPRQ